MKARLDELARARLLSTSDVVREAILEYIQSRAPESPVAEKGEVAA